MKKRQKTKRFVALLLTVMMVFQQTNFITFAGEEVPAAAETAPDEISSETPVPETSAPEPPAPETPVPQEPVQEPVQPDAAEPPETPVPQEPTEIPTAAPASQEPAENQNPITPPKTR